MNKLWYMQYAYNTAALNNDKSVTWINLEKKTQNIKEIKLQKNTKTILSCFKNTHKSVFTLCICNSHTESDHMQLPFFLDTTSKDSRQRVL